MPRAWPADGDERRPVASLLPYARNARTHSADQVAQIAAAGSRHRNIAAAYPDRMSHHPAEIRAKRLADDRC